MTLKDELMELAERFEAYDPGRSLDNRADELELHQAVVMATGEGSLNAPFDRTFARSLDTAMTLIPDRWMPLIDGVNVVRQGLSRDLRDKSWIVELYHENGVHRIAHGAADTASLALCAAALRTRASIKGSSHVRE